MSEVTGDFDPYSVDELISLLPDQCQNCNFACFIIGLSRIDIRDHLGPMQKINDIQEYCSGYEGSDPDSEYYSKGSDRSGCPYLRIIKAKTNL